MYTKRVLESVYFTKYTFIACIMSENRVSKNYSCMLTEYKLNCFPSTYLVKSNRAAVEPLHPSVPGSILILIKFLFSFFFFSLFSLLQPIVSPHIGRSDVYL